jgi:hypothetical protein
MEEQSTVEQDRRDMWSIAVGVIFGILFATAYGILADTRFSWIDHSAAEFASVAGADLRFLIPVGLVAPGMAIGWFGYPLVTGGHRRWPFGPREPSIARRRREHLIAWIVAYPIAVLAAGLAGTVSGFDADGGPLLYVQAPVDGARVTVAGLATFVCGYFMVSALIRRSSPRAVAATAEPA